jgi:hypothetical protein
VLWSFNLKFIVCPNDWITFQQNKDDFKILNELKLDRRTCCLSPNGLEDVCGRRNCTLPCTNPNPFIPELKKDPAESHFSRDRDRAFFIETSGSGDLSFRQAYAVESLEKVVQRRQSYFNGLHQPMDTKF